jgi:hypothetical protein
MKALVLFTLMCIAAAALAQTPASSSVPAPTPTKEEGSDTGALLKITRIYVDSFGQEPASKELQSMIVSSLVASKRFRVTENRERADVILKGNAVEQTSQEVHAYGDSTSVGAGGGGAQVNSHGGGSAGFWGKHMGTSDSSLNTETINSARVAIRLVNTDGDVIWTTTQESKGAKYKGATADAADKCVKKLLRDLEKAEATVKPSSPSEAGPATKTN